MQIDLDLTHDDPYGIRKAGIDETIIDKAFAFPRDELQAVRTGTGGIDIERTGVYILIGKNETGEQCAYIGEAENVAGRLNYWDTNADAQATPQARYWIHTVFLTRMTEMWLKPHARYVERSLIQDALNVSQWRILNSQTPPPDIDSIPERHRRATKRFASDAKILTGVLGWWDLFHEKGRRVREDAAPIAESPIYPTFYRTGQGFEASMQVILDDDGQEKFVVQAGSTARKGTAERSISPRAERIRAHSDVINSLQDDGNSLVFTNDVIFDYISRAATAVSGTPVAGGRFWRLADGITTYSMWKNNR